MADSKVPRLKDVAKRANVSLSAASRILRGQQDRFGEETCRRVEEAARELGWRRNLLVSGMQTGRTKMIGVLIPPFDSFWVGVLSGIHTVLADGDYLPITVWVGDARHVPILTDTEDDEGLVQISRLLDRRVEGLILWPRFAHTYNDHFRELMEREIPVAMIDYEYSADSRAFSIETDDDLASHKVADHLAGLGHRKIACVSTDEGRYHQWAKRRREQFKNALDFSLGIEYTEVFVKEESEDGVATVVRLLEEFQPTAVFAVTDHQAATVYHAAHELKLRIPEDLSVVGYADLDFAEKLSPPLTTVRQPAAEMGRQAARYVMDRLAGVIPPHEGTSIRIGTEFIERQSTGPPRKA